MTMDPTLPRGGSGLDTLRLCIKDFLATRRLNWLKKEDTMVKTDQSPLLADSTMVYDSIGNLAQGGQAREWTASAGQTASTWQTEAKVLGTCSRSLALTLILQQSLTVASVFTVGHIGTVELGAVSLATSMFDQRNLYDQLH
jgi:MATE family multidrug resistance protein